MLLRLLVPNLLCLEQGQGGRIHSHRLCLVFHVRTCFPSVTHRISYVSQAFSLLYVPFIQCSCMPFRAASCLAYVRRRYCLKEAARFVRAASSYAEALLANFVIIPRYAPTMFVLVSAIA